MVKFIDVLEVFEELLETAGDKELYRLRDVMNAYAEGPNRRHNAIYSMFHQAVREQIAYQEEMARDEEEIKHGANEAGRIDPTAQ